MSGFFLVQMKTVLMKKTSLQKQDPFVCTSTLVQVLWAIAIRPSPNARILNASRNLRVLEIAINEKNVTTPTRLTQ